MSLPNGFGLPRSMERASHEFSWWCLRSAPGHTLDQVMDPEYWASILNQSGSGSVGLYDQVRVIARDGAFCVDLMFREIDERRLWARVQLMHTYWTDADEEARSAAKDADGWEVNWGGPVHRWRIISPAGVLAAKGYGSRGEAEMALASLKSARAAA